MKIVRFSFIYLLLMLVALNAYALTITNTIVCALPSCWAEVEPNADCMLRWAATLNYNPALPSDAVIIQNQVTGHADDACQLGTLSVGIGNCAWEDSFTADILGYTMPDGSFEINVFDESDCTNNNIASFWGDNTITYVVENPVDPTRSTTNVEREIDYPPYYPPHQPIRPPRVDRCKDVVQSTYTSYGCNECNSYGSPRASFGLANFDVSVDDIPVWLNTVVGYPLELKMHYSNYGDDDGSQLFGPKWSCNWESWLRVVDASRVTLKFQSGSVVNFTNTAPNVFSPPLSVEGTVVFNGTVYQYIKPDGWTWQYVQDPIKTSQYNLERIWDDWSNTVTITYGGGKPVFVTQTKPDTGLAMQFIYNGTQTHIDEVLLLPDNRSAVFNYDTNGWLTNSVDMGGYSYGFSYTGAYMQAVTRSDGAMRTRVSYSSLPDSWSAGTSRWVVVEEGGGIVKSYIWRFGSVSEEIAGPGANLVNNQYVFDTLDSRGVVLSKVFKDEDPGQSISYNSMGRVTSRIDDTGTGWVNTYNDMKRITSVTDPKGNTYTNIYAANDVDLLYAIPPEGPVKQYYSYLSGRHAVASVSNALGQVTSYAYNDLGLVTNIFDGRVTVAVTYDEHGRITAQYRNGILMTTNVYDQMGRLVLTVGHSGLVVSNNYDALNRLTSQSYSGNGRTSVVSNHYDCCFIDKITDSMGEEWLYEYDDRGNKNWEENPAGLITYYQYDASGNPTLISNAYKWIKTDYTPEGRVRNISYPKRWYEAQKTESFTYDRAGRLVETRNMNGALLKSEYDAAGYKTASYKSEGTEFSWQTPDYVQVESNQYDNLGRLVETRNAQGLLIRYTYDDLDRVTRKTYAGYSYEEWTYNTWGDVTSFRDGNGHMVSNVYDGLGRLVETIDPMSNHMWFVYDSNDRLVSQSNAVGQAQHYLYDAFGRVTESTYPDHSIKRSSYDPVGNLTQVVYAGVATVYVYNEINQVEEIKKGDMTIWRGSYRPTGDLDWSQDEAGVDLWRTYDSWGQLDFRYHAGDRMEAFFYNGTQLGTYQNRTTNQSQHIFDVFNRPVHNLDGNGHAVSFKYTDIKTALLSDMYDGSSNKTHWTYDIFGRSIKKQYADLSFESNTYNVVGQLTQHRNPAGEQVAMVYDANGNLTDKSESRDSTSVMYQYNAVNMATSMTDRIGTTLWSYDIMGRVIEEDGPFENDDVSLAYDAAGRLTNVSFQSYTWACQYDDLDRMVGLQTPEGGYAFGYYYHSLKRTWMTYPNGTWVDFRYDYMKRMTNIYVQNSGGVLLDLVYGYDAGDRQVLEQNSMAQHKSFVYDGAGQLVQIESTQRPSDQVEYNYDAAGNLKTHSFMGLHSTNAVNNLNVVTDRIWTGGVLTVSGDVNYNAGTVMVNGVQATLFDDTFEATNVLLAAGTNIITAIYHGPAFTNTECVVTTEVSVLLGDEDFTYDSSANLTSDRSFLYHYDIYNQLTNVVRRHDTQTVLQVAYDGKGRRREVTRDGSLVERYVYLPGTFLVLAILDGNNQVKELYTHGPDISGTMGGAGGIGGLLSQRTFDGSTSNIYYHANAQGSTTLLTDQNGQEITTYSYSPFGQLTDQSQDTTARYLFNGKEFDPQTELYYYGYRHYNPRLNKWLTRDPLGEAGGVNLTSFCENDAVNHVDALGLEAYLVYREFNDPKLQSAYPVIGHFYLAFDNKGVDTKVWNKLVNSIGGQGYPYRDINTDAETFSFHPWAVRTGDESGNLGGTLYTIGSYVGYNDSVDQLSFMSFRAVKAQSQQLLKRNVGSSVLKADVMNLNATQDQQFSLYRAAIKSRDVNNYAQKHGDFGNYQVLQNNCGTWAKYQLESVKLSWPSHASFYNALGSGVGGIQDELPLARDITICAAIYGESIGSIPRARKALRQAIYNLYSDLDKSIRDVYGVPAW